MDLATLLLLSSGLFLGWSLGANDAANVFGAAVSTRMLRFTTAALVCSVFVIAGAVISGAGAADTLGRLGAIDLQAGAFTCALAAGLTVYYMTKWGLPVSTSQAIVGAIVGWNLFSGSLTDTATFVTIVSTWVLCPVLAGLIAVPLYVATRRVLRWANLHLLHVDALTRFALLFAGAFGAYSLGANNIANVMGVFVDVSPFAALSLHGGYTLTSAQQLFLLGALAIAVGVFTYSKRVMFTVGSGIVPMSPVSAWVVVIAHSIVLFAFASEGLERLLAAYGLPTIPLVPVSSSQAIVGAVVGLGLMRGGRDIDWRLVRNIGLGWLTTPLIAALVCFTTLFFVQNVFDQPVYREKRFSMSLEVINRLGEHTVVTEELAALKDREFVGAAAFLDALRERSDAPPAAERRALVLSEVGDFRIDDAQIFRIEEGRLSPRQIEALEELAGAHFRYRWAFAEALAAHTDEWAYLPDSPLNKSYNKTLRRQIEYVFRHFDRRSSRRPTNTR